MQFPLCIEASLIGRLINFGNLLWLFVNVTIKGQIYLLPLYRT